MVTASKMKEAPNVTLPQYRVTMVVADLGCVDLDFRSSLAGWPLL